MPELLKFQCTYTPHWRGFNFVLTYPTDVWAKVGKTLARSRAEDHFYGDPSSTTDDLAAILEATMQPGNVYTFTNTLICTYIYPGTTGTLGTKINDVHTISYLTGGSLMITDSTGVTWTAASIRVYIEQDYDGQGNGIAIKFGQYLNRNGDDDINTGGPGPYYLASLDGTTKLET